MVPALRRLRQEDGYEFQASLGSTVREILPHQTVKKPLKTAHIIVLARRNKNEIVCVYVLLIPEATKGSNMEVLNQ